MPSANKYGAQPTTVDGIRFASKREATRYAELALLQAAGAITALECHPAWALVVNGEHIGRYTADFRYVELPSWETVVEDVKGVRTRDYLLRKKLMRACHGITVVEV